MQRKNKRIKNVLFSEDCIDNEKATLLQDLHIAKKTLYIVPVICHPYITPTETINDLGEPIRVIWKVYATK